MGRNRIKRCVSFEELQKNINPWDIMNDQKEDFIKKASIYCMQSPVLLERAGAAGVRCEEAQYLTKEYWMSYLKRKDTIFLGRPVQIPEGAYDQYLAELYIRHREREQIQRTAGNSGFNADWTLPWDEMIRLLREEKRNRWLVTNKGNIDEKTIKEEEEAWQVIKKDLESCRFSLEERGAVCSEIEALRVQEQAEYIKKQADAFGETAAEDVFDMLAVLMLVEVSPTKANWKQRINRNTEHGTDCLTVPWDRNVIQLNAAVDRPYRYSLYNSDQLPEGSRIRVVRFEAYSRDEIGTSQAVIQFYSNGEKQSELAIEAGGYRYCSVAEDKIIKFLPLESAVDGACIRREEDKNMFHICREGQEEEILDFKKIGISDFSIGENGVIFISEDGKLYAHRYQPYEQNIGHTREEMESLDETFLVEVRLTKQGYVLLDEDGETYSDIGQWHNKKGMISLDGVE